MGTCSESRAVVLFGASDMYLEQQRDLLSGPEIVIIGPRAHCASPDWCFKRPISTYLILSHLWFVRSTFYLGLWFTHPCPGFGSSCRGNSVHLNTKLLILCDSNEADYALLPGCKVTTDDSKTSAYFSCCMYLPAVLCFRVREASIKWKAYGKWSRVHCVSLRALTCPCIA